MAFPRSSLLAYALAAVCLQPLLTTAAAAVARRAVDDSFKTFDPIELTGERRKTLGFGPSLPHATFVTDRSVIESVLPFSALEFTKATEDPFVVAAQFARARSNGGDNINSDFQSAELVLRKDSYTDSITGITHAFFRQKVYGKEIVDGHLAVNVHRGRVVSFSDSFHHGDLSSFVSPADNLQAPWESHCPTLIETSSFPSYNELQNGQRVLESGQHPLSIKELIRLDHLMHSNCIAPMVASISPLLPQTSDGSSGPFEAAFHLLATVTPNATLRDALLPSHDSFVAEANEIASSVYSTFEEEDAVHPLQSKLSHILNPNQHSFGQQLQHQKKRVQLLHNLPSTQSPVRVQEAFIQVPDSDKDDNEVVLVPVYHLTMELSHNWYEATVSTSAPHKIWSIVDWANDLWEEGVVFNDKPAKAFNVPTKKPKKERKDAAPPSAIYKVYQFGINDPSVPEALNLTSIGKTNHTKSGRTLEGEGKAADNFASPLGWHGVPLEVAYPYPIGGNNLQSFKGEVGEWEGDSANYSVTAGNNAICHENWGGRSDWIDNYRPDAGVSRNFTFRYKPHSPPADDPEDGESEIDAAHNYINATVSQLWYTTNMVHDLYYRYGFTEATGNFQQHNFLRGGAGSDSIITNAQDGSGLNNANFMTPPDGQHPRCRMYLWSTAKPYRDGDMEAGIVIHELSHGLSIRLTGGPANSACMGWGESGGMGEGWGDFLATVIRSGMEGAKGDYPMGAWASNRENGIRNFVYSVNETINPSTYKTLDKPGYWGVHAIGEVWAEMMFIVNQRLIEKHGFTDSLFPPPVNASEDEQSKFWRKPTDGSSIRSVLAAQAESAEYNARKGGGGDDDDDDQTPLPEPPTERPPPPLVPIHGNALSVLLSLTAMKLQPCNPSFFDARDAVIQADQLLTDGENECEIWEEFARRGLGMDASVIGRTPWGGGVRKNGFSTPEGCATIKK